MADITSTSTGYCTPQEMLIRYDRRLIGMLVSDSGTPVTTGLETDPVLLTMLRQASGEVESACLRGRRYSKEDLDDIYQSDTAAKDFLVWLVASIALYRLWQRRGDPSINIGDFNQALAYLEMLEQGKRIFPTSEHARAGTHTEFLSVQQIPFNDLRFKYNRLLGDAGLVE
jgi:hypothetical protein